MGIPSAYFLLCGLAYVAVGVFSLEAAYTPNLANLFFRSRMASKDPAETMSCFSQYMLESNKGSEMYSNSYNDCLLNTKLGRELIEKEMTDDRIQIATSSADVCRLIEDCNNLNTTLDLFSCHASIGANNTKAVYTISGNASELASIMQEKYRLLDLRHEQCCKAAERKYVDDTALFYRILQRCLDGRVVSTTAAPVTTTADTPLNTTTAKTTSPTAPVTTTTIATTTAKPVVSTTAKVENSSSLFGARELAAQILDIFK